MRNLTANNVTEVVLAKIRNTSDPRLKEILTAGISHLHGFARDTNLTMEEMLKGAAYLTKIGQISDEARLEFVLLFDTLGLTALVDAMENRMPPSATESSLLGPFYRAEAPLIHMNDNISRGANDGEPTFVSGRVLALDGTPLPGAMLDVWQAAADGEYENIDSGQPDMNLRGRLRTDAEGRYAFQTVKPSSYPIPDDGPVGQMLRASRRNKFRPAHIHFIVSAEGYKTLTTEVFVDGDRYLDDDAVFGVRDSLVHAFERHDDSAAAAKRGVSAPFYTLDYDFVLVPGEKAQVAFTAGAAKH